MKTRLVILFLCMFAFNLLLAVDNNAFYAADQSLFVMPTAYTMPKGYSAFTDYYVFILQYSYAMTNRTHLSAAMVFPITEDMIKTLTVGVKQNYYAKGKFQAAVWANYNPDQVSGTVGNVFSFGSSKKSIHLGITNLMTQNEKPVNILMAGGLINVSSRIAFMGEVETSTQALEKDTNGLLTFGIRFKGKDTSWDLGLIRLMQDNPSALLGLPFLKATFVF